MNVISHADDTLGTRPLRELVDSLWEGLLPRLANPIKVTETRTTRQVEVMGLVTYMIDHRHRRILLFRRQGGRLQRMHDLFDLTRPVRLWVWLEQYVTDARLPPERVRSVFEALKGRVRQVTSLRALAKQVRVAMALDDHPAWMTALRSRNCREISVLQARHFNLVWKHLEAFQLVERENPQLLPVLMLAIRTSNLELSGDPVAALKAHMLNLGLTQAGWRLLATMGYRGVAPALKRFGNESVLSIVVEYTRSLAQAGVRAEPSRYFMRVWLQSIEPGRQIQRDWHGHPVHVLRTAFRALAGCRTQREVEAFTLAFLQVDQWVLTKPEFDANQKKMPWSGLVERARTWEQLRIIEIQCAELEWTSLIPTFSQGEYTATPITTGVELFRESRRMRHCVFDYLDDCRSDGRSVFHVSQSTSGKPVATIVCENHCGTWHALDARGFANRLAPAPVMALAQECASRMNAEWDARIARVLQDIVITPDKPVVSQPFRGRVEWLNFEDWRDASMPALVPDDQDENEDPGPMDRIVAQAWGEGPAPASDWQWLDEMLYQDYHEYLVDHCLNLDEDNVPSPLVLLTNLEGTVEEARLHALVRCQASLTQDEWDMLRSKWIRDTLDNPDCDRFYTYVVLEIQDSRMRKAYLLGQVGGYSFSGYVFYLDMLCQYRQDAIEAVRRNVLPEAFESLENQ